MLSKFSYLWRTFRNLTNILHYKQPFVQRKGSMDIQGSS